MTKLMIYTTTKLTLLGPYKRNFESIAPKTDRLGLAACSTLTFRYVGVSGEVRDGEHG